MKKKYKSHFDLRGMFSICLIIIGIFTISDFLAKLSFKISVIDIIVNSGLVFLFYILLIPFAFTVIEITADNKFIIKYPLLPIVKPFIVTIYEITEVTFCPPARNSLPKIVINYKTINTKWALVAFLSKKDKRLLIEILEENNIRVYGRE